MSAGIMTDCCTVRRPNTNWVIPDQSSPDWRRRHWHAGPSNTSSGGQGGQSTQNTDTGWRHKLGDQNRNPDKRQYSVKLKVSIALKGADDVMLERMCPQGCFPRPLCVTENLSDAARRQAGPGSGVSIGLLWPDVISWSCYRYCQDWRSKNKWQSFKFIAN